MKAKKRVLIKGMPVKEYYRDYGKKNRKRISKLKREDYNNNKERHKEHQRKYYYKNRKEILIRNREYRNRHREEIRKNANRHYRKNMEKIKGQRRDKYHNQSVNVLGEMVYTNGVTGKINKMLPGLIDKKIREMLKRTDSGQG